MVVGEVSGQEGEDMGQRRVSTVWAGVFLFIGALALTGGGTREDKAALPERQQRGGVS